MKLKIRAQLVLAFSVVLGLILISSVVVYYKAADVGKKAAASCSAILSQEKATSHDRLHRCERATQILSHTVVVEVAAAVWRHFVPFGNFSVLEVVAQLGINSFSTYLGHYALRRVIPV